MRKDRIIIDLNNGKITFKALENYNYENKIYKNKKLYRHYKFYEVIISIIKSNNYKQRRKKTFSDYQGFFKNFDISTELSSNSFVIHTFKKIGNLFGDFDKSTYLEKKEMQSLFLKVLSRFETLFSKELDIIFIKFNKTKLDDINYHMLTSKFHTDIKNIGKYSIKYQNYLEDYVEKSSYSQDKFSKKITNGCIKYFRDRYSGRLLRGEVYHNINNMWWVVLNDNDIRNIASFHLFDINGKEANFKYRRLKNDFYKNRWKQHQRSVYEGIIEKYDI